MSSPRCPLCQGFCPLGLGDKGRPRGSSRKPLGRSSLIYTYISQVKGKELWKGLMCLSHDRVSLHLLLIHRTASLTIDTPLLIDPFSSWAVKNDVEQAIKA